MLTRPIRLVKSVCVFKAQRSAVSTLRLDFLPIKLRTHFSFDAIALCAEFQKNLCEKSRTMRDKPQFAAAPRSETHRDNSFS